MLGLDPARDPLARQAARRATCPTTSASTAHLTGRENLRYTARLNGIPDGEADDARIDELLRTGAAWPDAGDADGRHVLARHAPAPRPRRRARQDAARSSSSTSRPPSIDPVGVVEVLELVRELAHDQGVAVLLSSHLLHQVQQVCDRIAIFVAGDVVARGTVAEIAGRQAAGRTGDHRDRRRGDADQAVTAVLRRGPRRRPSTAMPTADDRAAGHRDRRAGRCAAGRSRRSSGAGIAPWLVRDRGMELDEIYQRYFAADRRAVRRDRRRSQEVTRMSWPPLPSTSPTPGWAATPGSPSACPPAGGSSRPRSSPTTCSRRACSSSLGILGVPGCSRSTRSPARTSATRPAPSRTLGASFLVLFTHRAVDERDDLPAAAVRAPGRRCSGPLLGIAFGFDAISSERAEGTLPRLVSQPIHRDDVINGKFVAGPRGHRHDRGRRRPARRRRGHAPPRHRARASTTSCGCSRWYVVTVIYVGFWLALATLCSVVFRRAATAALVVIAIWLVLTFFGQLHRRRRRRHASPRPPRTWPASLADPGPRAPLAADPVPGDDGRAARPVGANGRRLSQRPAPASSQRAVPTILPFGQSLLIIWPQVVALVAATVICFALAYIAFMRQEVRA